MSHEVQVTNNGVQSNDQEGETPQFCTQGGLETINLGEEVVSAPVAKTSKQRFQPKEDEIIIQSWLNVSKDPIVGVDKKRDSFWKRVGDAYNKHLNKNYKERKPMEIKSRWHKINSAVQKFVGCYKQAVATQKSRSSESNIILAAKGIFYQDEHKKFTFEDPWRLLKDEPKWLAGISEPFAKRTKNSTSGAYSSSSNPPTPTGNEYNPPSHISLRRPMGQKAAKRKEKEKFVEKSIPLGKIDDLQHDIKQKVHIMSEFSRNWTHIEEEKLETEKERLKINDLQILSKDTSNMNQRQLQAHEILCDMISKKYGLN